MGLETGYFWNNLNSFSNNTALVDEVTNKSISYLELEIESQALAEKLKLSVEGFIFLFKTNNSESVITYITSLKSNNSLLLLDKMLNDGIRIGLIENYKPDFIISSDENVPKLTKTRKYNQDMKSFKFTKKNLKVMTLLF